MTRIFRISALGAILILLAILSWQSQADTCVERVADLDRIDAEARRLFGSQWRTYLPMAHNPVVSYKTAEPESRPRYPEFHVQTSSRGTIEVKVGKESYAGQICSTKEGLRLDVLVLGGLVRGDSVDIRPSLRPGEILVVRGERPVNNVEYNWGDRPPQQWRYAIQDNSPIFAITNTGKGERGIQ